MALAMKRVSHAYGSRTAFATPSLDGVDLCVDSGEVLLLVGPTGCGKSTALRLLSGLAEPIEGTVEVDGTPPEPAAVDEGRRVGIAFQRPETQLFGETVMEDVGFGPRNLGMEPAAAAEAARDALLGVGLDPDEFGARSPFALSGGEARRIALAGVLALRPRYLLLDEPTAGLDAAGRAAVREAIANARRRGVGVVIATHEVDEFLPLATHVVALSRGVVRFQGTVSEYVRAAERLDAEGLPVPEISRILVLARKNGVDIPATPADAESVAAALLGVLRG